MAKNWQDISEDDLLNFDGAHTGQMSQYERIMQKKTQDSLKGVQDELSSFSNRIGSSTDRVVGVGNRLIETIQSEAKAQKKHQVAIVGLTVVIALATIAYTVITWFSVQAMKEANELQRENIELNITDKSNEEA